MRAAIERKDDDDLERRFAVSILNEVSHHGAQIRTLRDLYAHSG